MPLDWSPLWFTLQYAALATLLSVLAALPLGWLLARRRFPGRDLLDAAAHFPLLLPLAVLVYYLLVESGRWKLHFSWHAALAVSVVYTLPLLLRMIMAGIAAVDPSFENAARALGAGEWRTFWRVTLPLAWRPLSAAVLAGFARAFADFGATAMVAAGAGHAQTAWLLLPVAAVPLAALYFGNRLRSAQVPA